MEQQKKCIVCDTFCSKILCDNCWKILINNQKKFYKNNKEQLMFKYNEIKEQLKFLDKTTEEFKSHLIDLCCLAYELKFVTSDNSMFKCLTKDVYFARFNKKLISLNVINILKKLPKKEKVYTLEEKQELQQRLEDIKLRQITRYFLTLNNETRTSNELISFIKSLDDIEYCVFQKERGYKENTEHYQMMIIFSKFKSFYEIKSFFPKAYISPIRGTFEQCKIYCTKENTRIEGPFEIKII